MGINDFKCSNCHSNLEKEKDFLSCSFCKNRYKIINGIPDFRKKDEYWCNVSREKMQELNELARKSNNWSDSAKKIIPQYLNHFNPFYRADSQFLWPTDKESIILDVGSMWGGITIPAAQYHKEVYAVDKTIETLEFLDIRAKQMGFKNINISAASVFNLPFSDNFFDMVVLSGVLEWVPLEEDVVLEKQWQKTGRGLKFKKEKKYSLSPKEMQIKALKEINRVLKPSGTLYLAIENRFGYIYLAGLPDEHMNLSFVSFLPRFLSNFITKLLLNCQYRTYTYGIYGYNSLLKMASFSSTKFYGVFNHYSSPMEIAPLKLISSLKRKIFADKRWQFRLISKFIPNSFLKYFSPSIICFAIKDSDLEHESRLKQIFKKAKIINDNCNQFSAIKWKSRESNDLPVNYLVYTDKTNVPKYFCKISRDKNLIEALKIEAENLQIANSFLKGKEIGQSIPKLIYYGTIDNITFLVMEYIEGNPIEFSFLDKLKSFSSRKKIVKRYFLSINKIATKKWLKKINPTIKKAIFLLNNFQKETVFKKVRIKDFLDIQLNTYLKKINENNLLDDEILKLIKKLKNEIKSFNSMELPLVLEHGDYDLGNLLTVKDKIYIIDFEHTEKEKLPFLDLGNLFLNPLITQFKEIGEENIEEFANDFGWSKKIEEWISYYNKVSGISTDILIFLPSLAALEQNSKDYPKYRNPYTYPMYGKDILKKILKWNLSLKKKYEK